jgi:hypothetical protein
MMTLEIAFGDDPKRADGRERAAVVAVQFVPVIAVEDDFAIQTAWQLEAIDKRITRIEGSIMVPIPITDVVSMIRVPLGSDRTIQFNPPRLNCDGVIISITVKRIEVQRLPHRELRHPRTVLVTSMRTDGTTGKSQSGGVGRCEAAPVPVARSNKR